ncbi:MAG: hypothetical protein HOJ50_09915 [Proteobacteria bacterium]|nr:hypothetical protein [Pseudomonadota bacterium]
MKQQVTPDRGPHQRCVFQGANQINRCITVVGTFASPHTKLGRMRPAVAAFKCSEDAPAVTTQPPNFGEHTRTVLLEAGYSPQDIDNLAAESVT